MNTPLDKLPRLALVQDPDAKTEAYYSKATAPFIDKSVVETLKARLTETNGLTVRICLHEDTSADYHQMVIVHRKGGNFPRHKHLGKDESYHMIEGILRIELYADDGKPSEVIRVGGPETGLPFLVRIRKGVWHATVPETDFAVFHEGRPGPFKAGDSILYQEKP
jgi:cupin fold WbuC family metalloprotein